MKCNHEPRKARSREMRVWFRASVGREREKESAWLCLEIGGVSTVWRSQVLSRIVELRSLSEWSEEDERTTKPKEPTRAAPPSMEVGGMADPSWPVSTFDGLWLPIKIRSEARRSTRSSRRVDADSSYSNRRPAARWTAARHDTKPRMGRLGREPLFPKQPSPLTQSRTPDRVVDSELFAYPSRCNEYVI